LLVLSGFSVQKIKTLELTYFLLHHLKVILDPSKLSISLATNKSRLLFETKDLQTEVKPANFKR